MNGVMHLVEKQLGLNGYVKLEIEGINSYGEKEMKENEQGVLMKTCLGSLDSSSILPKDVGSSEGIRLSLMASW